MKNKVPNALRINRTKIYGMISALILLGSGAHAMATGEDKEERTIATLVVTNSSPIPSIQVCHGSTCKSVKIPEDLLSTIKDGNTKISAVDLTNDGLQEIVLTHAEEGSVNVCSKVYRYDTDSGTLQSVEELNNKLCNYSIEHDHIVSSYRSGAKWHEDIYTIKNNNLVLEITDSCVGCDYISRTLYLDGEKSEKLLVSNNINYALRTPISTRVISQKAILHNEPDATQITRMYLINGDVVALIGDAQSDDGAYWYNVRYITRKGKPISGWLQCVDIEFCTQ